MKDSLPYSQAIWIKRISSNQVDLNNSLKEMKNKFVKQGYHSSLINAHLERNWPYYGKRHSTKIKQNTSRNYIYQLLSNIAKTIWKNWNMLQINDNFKEIFKKGLITTFKWNKDIQHSRAYKKKLGWYFTMQIVW